MATFFIYTTIIFMGGFVLGKLSNFADRSEPQNIYVSVPAPETLCYQSQAPQDVVQGPLPESETETFKNPPPPFCPTMVTPNYI